MESAPESRNANVVGVRQVCLNFLELGPVCCGGSVSLLYFLEFLVCHFLGVDFPERMPHVDLELVPCHLQSALAGDQWLEPVPGDSFEQGSGVSCLFLIVVESVSFRSELEFAVGQEWAQLDLFSIEWFRVSEFWVAASGLVPGGEDFS
jgi:hypothetical protein